MKIPPIATMIPIPNPTSGTNGIPSPPGLDDPGTGVAVGVVAGTGVGVGLGVETGVGVGVGTGVGAATGVRPGANVPSVVTSGRPPSPPGTVVQPSAGPG